MANPTPTPTFEMKRTDSEGMPLVRLKGRLTLGEGSRSLRACLADIAGEGHKYVLLDLAAVTYVDSSGLGALVAGYNSLKSRGGTVVLFQVPKRIHDLIEISGLTAVFRMFGTEQEAAAGVGPA
jgi:anti-anti-sigma factor